MIVFGVVWWRWPLFLAYLALVAVVLFGGLTLVRAFPREAFGLFLLWLAVALAWPHRWYLAGRLRRTC